MTKTYTITVGELREHLRGFPDHAELFFGNGNLQFYRVKSRGPALLQIEFNQSTFGIEELPENQEYSKNE